MGRPHLDDFRDLEAIAEEWSRVAPTSSAGRLAARMPEVLDRLSACCAELAAVRVASEEVRAAIRGEERAAIVADLRAASAEVEARARNIFDGAISKTLHDAADRYESGAHIAAPEVPDAA